MPRRTKMGPAEIAAALQETDTDDRRLMYLAWCRLGGVGRPIVPLVARAFAASKRPRARESHVYYVTPYARFDGAAVELEEIARTIRARV